MPNTLNSTPATFPVSFFSCNSEQTKLFSVRPDVPAQDALDAASDLLDTAREQAYEVGRRTGDSSAHSAAYLIEMAKAAIDAVDFPIVEIPVTGNGFDMRFFSVIERISYLCDWQVLIINPDATEPAAIDALSFLAWVRQQKNGVAQ